MHQSSAVNYYQMCILWQASMQHALKNYILQNTNAIEDYILVTTMTILRIKNLAQKRGLNSNFFRRRFPLATFSSIA